MKRVQTILFVLSVLTACTATQTPGFPTQIAPLATITLQADSTLPAPTKSIELATVPPPNDDFFTQMGIALPAPACSGRTPAQTEGPYYIPNTPERTSLLEDGMQGTRLTLVGYVLDQNCKPLPNAWLDFWQADAQGEYDNSAYRLRGHQFTDAQGRYYLETILPGIYSSRPIRHIHVMVQPEGGGVVTSQLYFSEQPIEGLTVTTEQRGEYLLGYFSFVVQR